MALRVGSTVLKFIASRVETIVSGTQDTVAGAARFQQSNYRLTMEGEPDSAIGGKFYVDWTGAHRRPNQGGGFGDTIQDWEGDEVVVQVGYYIGGGDLGRGDRQSVAQDALDDVQRIADIVEDPRFYDSDNTGIREIRFRRATKLLERDEREIYAAFFWVQWRSDTAGP